MKTPQSTPAQPTGGRVLLRRKDGRTLNRTTLYLTPELARRLAIRAAETGQDQSTIVAAALQLLLAQPAAVDTGQP